MKRAFDMRSFLADPIRLFVDYKRALNRQYLTEAAALRLLDAYLADRSVGTWSEIRPSLIDGFLASRPRKRPRSYNHLRGVVHRFFQWAIVQGMTTVNPVQASTRRATSNRVPFLFNLQTATRLLATARALPDRAKGRSRGVIYEMIFALLYGLGLRVGEVARLRLGDFDPRRGTLLIRQTKFGKSRLVPMGPSLAARLRRYLENQGLADGPIDGPMFSFTSRGCVHEGTISQAFHHLVPQLGLDLSAGVSPPRVHDLRHSFAVGTLTRWYRQGVDANRRLIHLSTFLGHVSPTTTAVYLTITEELLRQANLRFHGFAAPGGAP
ncbi:MAG: tyrosine-type recombinase/integrase [Gammaproteobacteria bacterium]